MNDRLDRVEGPRHYRRVRVATAGAERVAQVAVRVELQDAQIVVFFRRDANDRAGNGVFAAERDRETVGAEEVEAADGRFDALHFFAGRFRGGNRVAGEDAAFVKRVERLFVDILHLVGDGENRVRALVRSFAETNGSFVRNRENVKIGGFRVAKFRFEF